MTRIGSGCTVLSTRITSAPKQPQISVACAPNPSRVKSRIRTPSRAIGAGFRSTTPRPSTAGKDSVSPSARYTEAEPRGGAMELNDLVLVSVDDHVVEPP